MTEARPSAAQVLDQLVDPGSFTAWDTDVVSDDPLGFCDRKPYPERLAAARRRTGQDEAVVTGRARIADRDVVVIAGEFGFLAGTMGQATAERVVRALERALDERLPVIGLPCSGGTRMQEGTAAFIQMANAAAAVQRLRAAGVPFVAWLRDPTTGGVLASWASLAHVRLAEPGALIGLTGPRVVESLTGQPMPEGIQVAEHLHERGLLDAVVPLEKLRTAVARILSVLAPVLDPRRPVSTSAEIPEKPNIGGSLALDDTVQIEPWAAVERSREAGRWGVRELLAAGGTDVTALRGDDAGADDEGCVTLLALLGGVGCMVVGHDRVPGRRGAQLGAVGYRKARRAFALADELGLPIVTMIDTEGAQATAEAEEGGLAAEIAGCLADLSGVSVPTLALLLGEGSGGGAIAFLPADRVLAMAHSWVSPIAPEGASAILHRTTERAPELARAQAISSTRLRDLGIVDVVVRDESLEGEDAQAVPDALVALVAAQLTALAGQEMAERLAARRERYRRTDRRLP